MIVESTPSGVRCIFVNTRLRGKRPVNPAYPVQLKTLGDHLRKVRLDLGLSQTDVARLLKVTTDSVTGWELNRYEPTPKYAKSIISFLGYIPFALNSYSLGKQLYYARLISGKTQRQVAKLIGCDASNLRYIELDQRVPHTKTVGKIEFFIKSIIERSLKIL